MESRIFTTIDEEFICEFNAVYGLEIQNITEDIMKALLSNL